MWLFFLGPRGVCVCVCVCLRVCVRVYAWLSRVNRVCVCVCVCVCERAYTCLMGSRITGGIFRQKGVLLFPWPHGHFLY